MPPLTFWVIILAGMITMSIIVTIVVMFIHYTAITTTVFACFCVLLIGYVMFSKYE